MFPMILDSILDVKLKYVTSVCASMRLKINPHLSLGWGRNTHTSVRNQTPHRPTSHEVAALTALSPCWTF